MKRSFIMDIPAKPRLALTLLFLSVAVGAHPTAFAQAGDSSSLSSADHQVIAYFFYDNHP